MEKITEAIKLHLPSTLKGEVQDFAMEADKAVSTWIRDVLIKEIHGLKGINAVRYRSEDRDAGRQ